MSDFAINEYGGYKVIKREMELAFACAIGKQEKEPAPKRKRAPKPPKKDQVVTNKIACLIDEGIIKPLIKATTPTDSSGYKVALQHIERDGVTLLKGVYIDEHGPYVVGANGSVFEYLLLDGNGGFTTFSTATGCATDCIGKRTDKKSRLSGFNFLRVPYQCPSGETKFATLNDMVNIVISKHKPESVRDPADLYAPQSPEEPRPHKKLSLPTERLGSHEQEEIAAADAVLQLRNSTPSAYSQPDFGSYMTLPTNMCMTGEIDSAMAIDIPDDINEILLG